MDGCADFDAEYKAIPTAAQVIPAQFLQSIRSFKNIQLRSATTAGMADMMMPAATAVVNRMPNSMHTENKKFPRNDSRNNSFLVE